MEGDDAAARHNPAAPVGTGTILGIIPGTLLACLAGAAPGLSLMGGAVAMVVVAVVVAVAGAKEEGG